MEKRYEIVEGERCKVIAEGKTKMILEVPGTDNEVYIRNKPVLTKGDGAEKLPLEGKDIWATTATCNCFELLNREGVSTHYIRRVDERTLQVYKLEMIPIELVARRIAYGSLLKREPYIKEGTVFPELKIEFFLKDDSRNDPFMVYDPIEKIWLLYEAKKPTVPENFIEKMLVFKVDGRFIWRKDVEHLEGIIEESFLVLEEAFGKQGTVLVDLKIECGFYGDTGKLLAVGDVIDGDCLRVWPGGREEEAKDKQLFRDTKIITPEVKSQLQDNYRWVAEATTKFLL